MNFDDIKKDLSGQKFITPQALYISKYPDSVITIPILATKKETIRDRFVKWVSEEDNIPDILLKGDKKELKKLDYLNKYFEEYDINQILELINFSLNNNTYKKAFQKLILSLPSAKKQELLQQIYLKQKYCYILINFIKHNIPLELESGKPLIFTPLEMANIKFESLAMKNKDPDNAYTVTFSVKEEAERVSKFLISFDTNLINIKNPALTQLALKIFKDCNVTNIIGHLVDVIAISNPKIFETIYPVIKEHLNRDIFNSTQGKGIIAKINSLVSNTDIALIARSSSNAPVSTLTSTPKISNPSANPVSQTQTSSTQNDAVPFEIKTSF